MFTFLPETAVHFILWDFHTGDASSLPVCSVSCTLHLHLFINIDIYYRLGQNLLKINKYSVITKGLESVA